MSQSAEREPERDPLAFLAGGGEMGERTRAFDWGRSPLGPAAGWPRSLKTVVRVMLDSRYAMWLGWGPDLTFFYNDAYARMTLGPKHPWALGRPAREVWSEIWGDIGPRAESVVRTGVATWDEGLLLFLERSGFPEETYHTFSYSPVPDDRGAIGGMLCVVTEDTERTIGERRLRTLRELAAQTTYEAKSAEDACQAAAQTLAANPRDLPFALLYLLDDDGRRARRAGLAGVGPDLPISPAAVAVDGDAGDGPWPFGAVIESGRAVAVDDPAGRFVPLPGGAWPESPRRAVVLPMARPGQARLAGFVVAGVSPRRPFDDAYRGFLDLLAGQVATAVANARAYEEERRRAETLAALDRAKSAFFSNVSHEFRTPLTLLLGPVEDLLAAPEGRVPPEGRALLEVVNRNGLRLLRLVNSLLDFSRIEAGRARATYEPTDLAAFTAELASVFRAAVERAGLRLVVDCPDLGEPVFVDREMWEKVVLNLLSNAFKFTFEGEIAVRLRRGGEVAELTVGDTGTGVPAEEMPRLFERFHRVENARGRTHEGSGIGLALVQELVKLHGGSVHAESVDGGGTTFFVRVPLGSAHLPADRLGAGRVPAPTTAASPYVEEALRWLPEDGDGTPLEPPFADETLPVSHARPGAEEAGARPRILVADDNADMRRYVVRLLAERYRVEAVADGEAALASARERAPDLVLSDVMMPRLDGFGLLAALRADPRTRDVPVILLSARAGEESRVEGMEAGADDYLVKPFSARELLARVSAHLQMARLRREASASLREGEERLRMALTAARMVAWQFDPETGAATVSENAGAVLGLPPGRTLEHADEGFALVHPDDVERHRAVIMRAFAECGSYFDEFRMVRPDDGAVLWMEERGHAVCDAPGRPARLVGVLMDVTERRQAEARERQLLAEAATANAQFRAFFEQGALFAGIMAVDGTLLETNRLALEACGYTREEVVGRPFWECPWWSPSPALARQIEAASARAAAGATFRAELPYHVAGGGVRLVDLIILPIKGESGRVLFLAPTGTDVTDRKRAEEDRHKFVSLAENSTDFIGMCNLEGIPTYVNRAGLGLVGLDDVEQARRTPVREFFFPEDQPRMVDDFLPSVLGRGHGEIEVRFRHFRTGDALWMLYHVFTLTDAEGRLVGLATVSRDITQRRRLEDDLRRSAAELSEADRRKDEFLATLAHELRNPLAPVRNALQIMRLAGDDRHLLDESRALMERQVAHMVRLIDDLMDVSRITRDKLELRRERVELAAVVRHAVDTSRPLVEAAGHELAVTLPARPIFLDADLTRLSQVFANLLNNAAKYTEPGGDIALVAERRGSDVVVTVRDNGVGIPAEMLPHVFDLFTQVDRTLERAQGGLGIGLTLVRRLVEMHGGTIEARSAGLGLGSEFLVRLPVEAAPVAAAGTPGDGAGRAPAGREPGRRILVVDDNRDSARTLARLLTMRGHEVRTAFDGGEAVAAAEEFRPEVLLLDIGLPGMSGYEVARALRERPWGRDARIIALTGWGQEGDRRRSREAGFDHHLVKPVDVDAMLDLLQGVRASPA